VNTNRNKSIAERIDGFRRYYARQNERPLLGFYVGGEYPLHRYEAAKSLPEDRLLRADDFEVEPYLDDCDRLFALHEECGGDLIWGEGAFWGIPWVEAALGCGVKASHLTGSTRSEPPPGFAGPDSISRFDVNNPWVQKAIEFTEKVANRSNGRWPIASTLMRGVADLLSALYGGQEFIFRMMDRPEEVKQTAEKLTEFFIAFGQSLLEHIPLFHGGVGIFCYCMWVPRPAIAYQEDAASLLSPQLYERFIAPCDKRIAESFSGSFLHQHSTGFIPVDSYLSMNFTVMEMHIDKGGPCAEELYETHMKMLEKKPLLIWGAPSDKDLDWIFSKLPPQGLAINTIVADLQRVQKIWDRYIG